MKQIAMCVVAGFIIALLPARFWICAAIAAAALVFALGIWAIGMIIRGAVTAYRAMDE